MFSAVRRNVPLDLRPRVASDELEILPDEPAIFARERLIPDMPECLSNPLLFFRPGDVVHGAPGAVIQILPDVAKTPMRGGE